MAPFPPDESLRLQALYRLKVLDTQFESSFDRITQLAAQIYGAPMSTITLIDANRQWHKACVGMAGRESSRDMAFCAHTILQDQVLVIPDALQDTRVAEYPNVTGDPHIRFYAGAPLVTSDGYAVGTICVIDTVPRSAVNIDTRPLKDLAAIVSELLESRHLSQRLLSTENAHRDAEQNYRSIVADLRQIVFQLDSLGNWTFLNPAWTELSGIPLADVLGKSWLESVHSDDREQATALWSNLAAGPTQIRETFRCVGQNESTLWLEMSARSNWGAESRFTGVTGTLYDLTESKKNEETLLRSKAAADSATIALFKEVQERRRVEAQLAAERERLELTLDTAADPFLAIDKDGNITGWNQAAERLFGRKRREVIGKSVASVILPERFKEAYRERLRAFVQGGVPEMTGKPIEVAVLHRDGFEIPVEITLWPLTVNGTFTLQSFVKDISSRKAAEAKSKREQEMSLLLQTVTALANKSQSVEEAVTVCVEQVCTQGNFNLGHFYLKSAISGAPVCTTTIWWERNSGQFEAFRAFSERMCKDPAVTVPAPTFFESGPVWYEDMTTEATLLRRDVAKQVGLRSVFAFPVTSNGETLGVLEFFSAATLARDEQLISVGHTLGAQLGHVISRKQLEASLRKAKQTAEEASHAKSAFVAAMSHEIRTPMNAILGMADVLAETPLTPDQSKYVEIFRRAGTNLLALLNSILDLSKIEAGHFELERIDFDLHEIIERTMELIRPRLKSTGITLISKISPAVPRGLVGDPMRLQQIFINLLGNAAKFTEAGEISLSVQAASLDNLGHLQFEVSDTGIGIPKDKLSAIFEDFSQVDASTTRKYGGTGLGLGIAKRLVSMMGGSIEVDSTFGQGTTFRFTILLPVSKTVYGHVDAAGDFLNCRVLVVDDDPTNRLIFKETLQSWGLVTHTCSGGDEAARELAKAQIESNPYALVLLDYNMPGASGFEVASRLRSESPHTPVVVLSSDNRPGEATRCFELGLQGYENKPISRSDLLRLVRNALSMKAGEPDARLVPHQSVPRQSVPRRLLLAEDSPDNRTLIQAYLAASDYSLTFAEDGREAVELFEKETFDLVLMDMQMPVMDGLEATRAIRLVEKRSGRTRTPILALTANAMTSDVRATQMAGADGHLTKPISKQKLLAAMDEYTRVSRQTPAPNKILVEIPEGLEELVPQYLAKRKTELQQLTRLLEASDFQAIRHISHNLKGTGEGYGFAELTSIGGAMETAARDADMHNLASKLRELSSYLDAVEVVSANG